MHEPILTNQEREAINAGRWFGRLSPSLRHDILRSAYVKRYKDGALICARQDDFWQRIRRARSLGGAVLGPFEAWLLQRGLRTLFVRVRAAAANADQLARFLASHPAVRAVRYPGLANDPGHAVARKQMHGGFGTMLWLQLAGGAEHAKAVAGRLRLFRLVLLNIAFAGASELVREVGMDWMSQDLAARLSARAAQGIGAGLLTARLGIKAMEVCRPLPWIDGDKPRLGDFRRELIGQLKETLNKKPAP